MGDYIYRIDHKVVTYAEWFQYTHGEPLRYDENGNELIPDAMIGKGFKKEKRVPLNPRNRVGYVYLLAVPNSPGLYKIGRAANPENRLRTFNVKLPFPVHFEHVIKCADMYQQESMLHKLFVNQRVNGEFFNLSSADVSFIKLLAGN